ncbi:kinesin-like protein KIF20B [Ochotona curzoniae]|uniref:kinesin-like protein KIF20B n=1 Tax=Ochotona curzoniae TaxID=130825 RepID=UPI001B34C1EB|nr:kinesin-like protein KIF20B [Ochotona curzoniae]
MAVKHAGCATPVTVKISKARKRKSNEMEEDFVKCENKKNATPRSNLDFPVSEHRNSSIKKEQKVSIRPSPKKTYSLRSQAPTIDVNLTTKKKEGTFQKFGDSLQRSPTILQSKVPPLDLETWSSGYVATRALPTVFLQVGLLIDEVILRNCWSPVGPGLDTQF